MGPSEKGEKYFNTSMAYLANYYTQLSIKKVSADHLEIEMIAPINFYPGKEDTLPVYLTNPQGEDI